MTVSKTTPFADGLAHEVAPALSQAAQHADDLLQLGAQALRQTSTQLRTQAHHASDATLDYIKREPIKAVLISAAAGAAVAVLLSLINGNRKG